MSDEPPAELFGSDSLPETDDVIKGDETMEFSTSEESSKMVNADFQKVMDSISVSADGVDVDDEKLLSQFVVGNLGADDHHHGPTAAEESSSSSLADEKALLESVLARAANSDQVATLGDQVATLGDQVATLGGQGRTLGSLVGALSGHVASPAAGDETPEETMQVERLMESIHSGSSNDEPKVAVGSSDVKEEEEEREVEAMEVDQQSNQLIITETRGAAADTETFLQQTLQDDDDTISSTTIAVPTTTTYQSLTSLQAAADIFGDDEDDDDDVIKAAGMQSSTADDNGSQQTVMTALVGGGGVITASGGGYVMTSSSSGGGQLMTSSVVREEEELTSVEDVLSALHSELDEEEEAARGGGGGGGGGGEEIKKVEEKSKWKLKVEQQRQQQAQVTKPAKPSSDGASGPMYKCFVSGCKSTTSSAAGSGATSGGKSVTTSAGAGSGATSGGKSVTTSAGAGSGATSGGEMRFFKPPPNPLIFKRWARNLCQGSQQLAYTALICELHFRPQDIREVFVNGKKKWVLTEGALPKPSTASALAAAAAQGGSLAALQAGNGAAAAMTSPGGKRPVGRPSGLYRQQQFEALQAAQARANKLQREKLSQDAVVEDEKTSTAELLYTLTDNAESADVTSQSADNAAVAASAVSPSDQSKPLTENPQVLQGLEEDLEELDVFVCGLCHTVFHFVEQFQEHRARVQCRGTSTFKASLSESKPHVWAFLLWKNAQTKILGETESSWKLYQRWCKMTDQLRETWIAAGRDLQANSCVVQHLQSIKNGKSKTASIYSALEEDEDIRLRPYSRRPEWNYANANARMPNAGVNQTQALTIRRLDTNDDNQYGNDRPISSIASPIDEAQFEALYNSSSSLAAKENILGGDSNKLHKKPGRKKNDDFDIKTVVSREVVFLCLASLAAKENILGGDSNKLHKKPGRKKNDDFDIKTEKKDDFGKYPITNETMVGPADGLVTTQEEFVVEKIVSRRFNQKKKQYEYLLKWEGYPPEQNTWEPAQNMSTCQHLLAEFESNLAKQGAAKGASISSFEGTQGGTLSGPLKKGTPAAVKQEMVDIKQEVASPPGTPSGRPVRSSKKKALDQVKVWCGSMIRPLDMVEGGGGALKRSLSDDSDYSDNMADYDGDYKRIKMEDSDSDTGGVVMVPRRGGANSVVGRARAQINGLKRERDGEGLAAALGLESDEEGAAGQVKVRASSLSPTNQQVLVASAKGVVKVDPSQVPNLTSGVYIMSNKSGIVKLDSVTPNSAISSLQRKGLLKSTPSHKSGVIMLGSRMGPGAAAATKSGILRRPTVAASSPTKQPQSNSNTLATTAATALGGPRPVGPLRPVPKPSNIISRQTGVMSKQAPVASRLHGLNKGVLTTPSPLKRPGSMLKSGIKPIESILGTVGQLRKKDELGTPQKRILGGGARGGVARGGKSTAKMIHKGATVVPRTSLVHSRSLESYAGGTGEPDVVVGLPDDFPPLGDLPPITPDSPPRPLTLCPLTAECWPGQRGAYTPAFASQGGHPPTTTTIQEIITTTTTATTVAQPHIIKVVDTRIKSSRDKVVMSKQAPVASRLHGLNKGVLTTPSPLKRPGSMLKSGIKPIESILGTKKDELGTPQKRILGGGARGGVARGGKSTAKMIHKGATVVPRTTLSSTLGVMNTDLDNIKLESYAGGTGETDVVVGLPDDFPPLGDLPPITPDSPPRPPTLCPLTGRVLARAEGEPTPPPSPPTVDIPTTTTTIQEIITTTTTATTVAQPHIIKVEMSSQEIPANVEPATVSVRKVASRSRAKSKGAANAAAESATSLGTITVPSRKISYQQQQQQQQQQIVVEQQPDEIDDNEMVTITGDDGLLYQVSQADLRNAGGGALLVDGGYVAGEASAVTVEAGDQGGATQVLTLDSAYADAVAQLIPEQFYVKEGGSEGGVAVVEAGGGGAVVVDGAAEGGVVVGAGGEDEEEGGQVVAQLVEACEPTPGGGRRVVLLLPDGNLMMTEVDEEQYAALGLDNK
ncbi:uncharacterized protein LOC111060163 [Nilaparvata lugens]|uniref:uncharacterized protein LOC111060163 n=1 Tax=Nilaparvata lugens TaxID=108931 RepID=UPI00193DE162|nr:uncharacterized protein LOC111060163 [Nilaparvata lugens]